MPVNGPGYAQAFSRQELPEWDPADYEGEVYSAFPATTRDDEFVIADPGYAPPAEVGQWNHEDGDYDWEQVIDEYPAAQVWRTAHYYPPVEGAAQRFPDPPLPVLANAGALMYSTPGELAALDKAPHRIDNRFWHSEQWNDPTIDGRHLIFPRVTYPLGDGPMAPQLPQVSVRGPMTFPALTSELALSEGGDYAESLEDSP